jgi:hypothetical protein
VITPARLTRGLGWRARIGAWFMGYFIRRTITETHAKQPLIYGDCKPCGGMGIVECEPCAGTGWTDRKPRLEE